MDKLKQITKWYISAYGRNRKAFEQEAMKGNRIDYYAG